MVCGEGKIILGIDPGSQVMGYGVVRTESQGKFTLLHAGSLHIRKHEHLERYKQIFLTTSQLIEQWKPAEMAIEQPFYGRNVQSMLMLGRAQGMAIAAAVQQGLEIFEYAPLKVKKAVTGRGQASKEQVAGMLQHLMPGTLLPTVMDATDAIAVAVCHCFQGGPAATGKSYNSWDAFLKANPGRAK